MLLDVDRTLFRTGAFNEALQRLAVEEFHVVPAAMHRAQQIAERTASFYPVDWLVSELGEAEFARFVARFQHHYAHEDFLYDDAKGMLAELAGLEAPLIAMTHGGQLGQPFKLMAARITFPFVIIDQPNKGERLQQSYNPSTQRYEVATDQGPVYHARGFVLVDDKNRNFAGLAANAPHVLCIHLEGRARSGNDAAPAVEVQKVADLRPVPAMIRRHVARLQAE